MIYLTFKIKCTEEQFQDCVEFIGDYLINQNIEHYIERITDEQKEELK